MFHKIVTVHEKQFVDCFYLSFLALHGLRKPFRVYAKTDLRLYDIYLRVSPAFMKKPVYEHILSHIKCMTVQLLISCEYRAQSPT